MRSRLLLVMVAASLILVTARASADLMDGLIGHYPFDGNADDATPLSVNHGVAFGATLTNDRFGNSDSAYRFDGTDDRIDLPYEFASGLTDVSVSCWLLLSSTPTGIYGTNVVYEGTSGLSFTRLGMFVMSDRTIRFGGRGQSNDPTGSFRGRDSAVPISLGQWHHLVGIWDGGGGAVRIYIDGQDQTGVVEGTGVVEALGTSPASEVSFGGRLNSPVGQFFLDGVLDDVRMYDRVLTAGEIQQLFTSNAPGVAVAGTSLDMNDELQLDGSLSSDPEGDPLSYSWQILGEANPRLGKFVSISDLAADTYTVTLTVVDIHGDSSSDTMLLGVPECTAGPPSPGVLQQAALDIKDMISGFPLASFDAPNDNARENRRKALLNMLCDVVDSIEADDYAAAIDQLGDILAKSDGLDPPDSPPDWLTDVDDARTGVADAVIALIADLQL